jgi:hypothetical protein
MSTTHDDIGRLKNRLCPWHFIFTREVFERLDKRGTCGLRMNPQVILKQFEGNFS